MQNTFCVFRAFCEPFNFNLLRLKQKSPAVKIQRGFGYARAVIAREALRPKQSPLLNKEIASQSLAITQPNTANCKASTLQ